jgi:plastocyanin
MRTAKEGLMRRLMLALAVPVLTVSLVVAACGGDDEDEATPTPPPAEEPTPTTMPPGDPTPTDAPDPTPEPTPAINGGATELELAAMDFAFQPNAFQAAAGEEITVAFRNDGSAPHTFTIDALFVDELLSGGEDAVVTVPATDGGVLDFYCRIHPSMTGTITIGGGSEEGADAGSSDAGAANTRY